MKNHGKKTAGGEWHRRGRMVRRHTIGRTATHSKDDTTNRRTSLGTPSYASAKSEPFKYITNI